MNKRKAFVPVSKKMDSSELHPFMRYLAQLKVTYQDQTLHFHSPSDAENFLSSIQKPSSLQVHAATLPQGPQEMDASSQH